MSIFSSASNINTEINSRIVSNGSLIFGIDGNSQRSISYNKTRLTIDIYDIIILDGLWEILKELSYKLIITAMTIVRRVLLKVIDFWEFPSIPKISEPFEIFIDLLPVFIFDAELKDNISDTSLWLDEVILLELRCMADLMSEDDVFCKLEMDDLIFSEYSQRTPSRACLYCWSSWYLSYDIFS